MSDNNELVEAVRDWQRLSVAYRLAQERVQALYREMREAESEMVRIAGEQA